MELDVVKVYENNLPLYEKENCFICKENELFCFSKRANESLLFIDTKSKQESDKLIEQSFSQYVKNLCEVEKAIQIKSSMLFINCNFEFINELKDKFSFIDQKELFNDDIRPFVCNLNDNIIEILSNIMESRNDYSNVKNNLYIIVDGLERLNIDISKFVAIMTVAKSRKINFVLNIQDSQLFSEKYGEEVVNIIDGLCSVHFYNKIMKERCGIAIKTRTNSEVLDDYNNSNSLKLKKGNLLSYIKSLIILGNNVPKELKEWLRKYDGGKINSTIFFGTKNRGYVSLKEANSKKYLEAHKLSKYYRYFAMDEESGAYYAFNPVNNGSISREILVCMPKDKYQMDIFDVTFNEFLDIYCKKD